MRHPESIPRLGLVDILSRVRDALYFDDVADEWDRFRPSKQFGDPLPSPLAAVDAVMATAGLLPYHAETASCHCPFCEDTRADSRPPAQKCMPAP